MDAGHEGVAWDEEDHTIEEGTCNVIDQDYRSRKC